MKRPSLCFVSMHMYPLLADSADSRFCGGAQLQQLLIGRELAARGHEVSFVTRDHGQGPEERLGPFRVLGAYRPEAGLPVLRFYHPRLGGLMKALRRANADIYTIRGADGLLAPIVYHAKRTGRRVLFAGASNSDFDPGAKHFKLARDRFLYWWGLRRVDAVIAQNEDQASAAREHLGIEAPIVHNALPDASTGVSRFEDILWVGGLRPKKIPERFVDLAASFPEQSFVMVGGIANPALYPRGPVTSDERPVESLPNLQYTGYLPPSQVDDYYGRAKVLINTSDVEGFPNTFLHAWAWGVPVLSYVDPDSIVEKNGLGWIVSSPEEMKSVLAAILSGELKTSPERILKYYESECMSPRQGDQYQTVIEELAGR